MKKKIAVIGAGHGGKAMAADLTIRGFDVFLFNRTQKRITAIQERGGILLKTEENREVFAPMNLVTTDIEEVLREVNLVMVVIPASGHRNIAKLMAPFLQDNHIVLLNPGRTGGVLEFKQVLNECENPTILLSVRRRLFYLLHAAQVQRKLQSFAQSSPYL